MANIGPIYVEKIKYPHRKFLPIVEKGWTHEIEEPYRKGTCLVFRAPFTRTGFVCGKWKLYQDEVDALTGAIWARELDVKVEDLLKWD